MNTLDIGNTILESNGVVRPMTLAERMERNRALLAQVRQESLRFLARDK